MSKSNSTSWRRPLLAIALVSLVFAGVIVAITLNLRTALRAEILQREGDSMEAVATMQLRALPPGLAAMERGDNPQEMFEAVLESSRLRGVLAVQLFDARGMLLQSLPFNETPPESSWWREKRGANHSAARFHPHGNLESVYGEETKGKEGIAAALLEVNIPLRRSSDAAPLGSAHYWIDGQPIAEEFARVDRSLESLAATAFAVSVLALAGVVAWAFNRLERANRQLRIQGDDLVRANQELAFAAKTAAIGAISAHLIHEIKNPLSGLECLVSYQNAKPEDPELKESWQMAADATRRLREMINEVLGMLREEANSNNEYTVNAIDVVNAVVSRLAAVASRRGVRLTADVPESLEMNSRSSNLAGLILSNLAANALEAAPAGSEVRMSASVCGDVIEFDVSDTGPGLPPLVKENLFQPVNSGKPGGTGVGLAISRQLALHLGGRLLLRRTGPDGTVLTLSIPAPVKATAARA